MDSHSKLEQLMLARTAKLAVEQSNHIDQVDRTTSGLALGNGNLCT